KFAVVGDGQSRGELEAYARSLGIASQVIFTGWRRDLPTLYADLNVLALSSNNEGTPVSIIEAMAAGVPVVATSVGGVPDLVREGETGFLVKAEDIGGMAAAILELVRNPERAERMGQEGQRLAQENYSVHRLLERTRSLYLELLRAKGLA
ncbi:MAG: glycosyltransferase, partial [Chloroflexi bacterium]|nr:glycosyltransferase [Chloroflexota bacterium]